MTPKTSTPASGRAGGEDALLVAVGIGRNDGEAVVLHLQEVVGHYAFQGFAVAETAG